MALVLKIYLILVVALVSAIQKPDYAALRKKMVNEQLEQRGITSGKVLDAMRKVERHLFVPVEYRNQAYEDYPLPIGAGQTISQPYIVAFMTEALDIKATERILEIGTGSGYQASILGELCREVYTIEIVPTLAEKSESLLRSLGYKNVNVKMGDGYLGWPEKAPFDVIIVTCSPSHVPQALQRQLKEGGRMIIPVGERYAQELVLLKKKNGKLTRHSRMQVQFVPMMDSTGKKY
jgi:protein-L-isoaspartate(D-aspartate) O-methyltransferase